MKDIIVEGTDGAGKTTLINQLIDKYGLEQTPRQATSLGGPISNICDLIDALRITKHERPWIYDRHSLFSERVYGPILRGCVTGRFNDPRWVSDVDEWCRTRTVVVYCDPGYAEILKNVGDDSIGQLDGVTECIEDLYAAYVNMMSAYDNVIRYDYRQTNAFTNLCSLLENRGVFAGGSLL